MPFALYLPFLRGRKGELEAIHRFSPYARARVAPVIDLPTIESESPSLLEEHVGGFARDVATAWGTGAPLYLDLTRYGPDRVDTRGRNIVEHLFHCAEQLKLLAIPVSGPKAERGPGTSYLDAVARIAARQNRGAALRLRLQDFADSDRLASHLDDGLSSLRLRYQQIDLFLDAESIAATPETTLAEADLLATLLEALQVVSKRAFRTVVFAASSVPESPTAPEDGGPRTFTRGEYRVWKEITRRVERPLVRFGDTAVWNPRQLDRGGGGGAPPGRVRVPVDDRQIFFRGVPESYPELCRQATRYPGVRDLPRCWGLDSLYECAAGSRAPENATTWVARDTNVHIEATVRAVEAHLRQHSRLHDAELAAIRPTPWQQESLVATLEGKS